MPIKGRRATPQQTHAIEERARRLRSEALRRGFERVAGAIKPGEMSANFARMLVVTVKAWS